MVHKILRYILFLYFIFFSQGCETLDMIKSFLPEREEHQVIVDTTQLSDEIYKQENQITLDLFLMRTFLYRKKTNLNDLLDKLLSKKVSDSTQIYYQFNLSRNQVIHEKIFIPRHIKKLYACISYGKNVFDVVNMNIAPQSTNQIYIRLVDNKGFISTKYSSDILIKYST